MLRLSSTPFTIALLLSCVLSPAQSQAPVRLALRYASFDPLDGEPPVPPRFTASPEQQLSLVQFHALPAPADRAMLQQLDVEIAWYAPQNGFVVRANAAQREAIAKAPAVRWVGAFHPAYRLEAPLLASLLAGARPETSRYLIVMVDPQRDEPSLIAAIERAGGSIWRRACGNLLIEADLTPAQLATVVCEDTVLWIERATAIGLDMDNARIQGGANYIEAMAGHTGKGVRGHVMEGIHAAHPEYAANAYRTAPVAVFSGAATTHGNSTFGEVFSAGVVPQARGMCPDGQGYFTDLAYIVSSPPMSTAQNTRYGIVQAITDPTQPWRVMFQTASWGDAQTMQYTSRSAEMDWIIHRFDIPICQSQADGGLGARPQWWAKNIVSVGGITHHDTANPNDDTQSGPSLGPALDGRIKPEICGYQDAVFTTDGPTTYTSAFSGGSAATPMVAGHIGLIVEMFTDGYFGHAAAPSWQQRFDYKPHSSTAKALLIDTARQYDPAIVGDTANRFRQGWGFPALQDLYDLRNNMLVVDELDVLQQGQTRTYWVQVKPGTPQLRATMTYSDLPASPTAAMTRVDDLDLKVTSPGGTIYYGNHGMATGTSAQAFTSPGGAPNAIDTVENVYVQNPATGLWRIDVSAPLVALDQHVETTAVDADFALVASGIGGGRDTTGPQLDLASTAPGNLSIALTSLPASFVDGYVMFSLSTARPRAMGSFLGLEIDSLSFLSLSVPATAGDPLHFPPTTNPSLFPNAPYVFPPFVPAILQGFTLDAVAFFFDATGAMHAASNVDRVVVQ